MGQSEPMKSLSGIRNSIFVAGLTHPALRAPLPRRGRHALELTFGKEDTPGRGAGSALVYHSFPLPPSAFCLLPSAFCLYPLGLGSREGTNRHRFPIAPIKALLGNAVNTQDPIGCGNSAG